MVVIWIKHKPTGPLKETVIWSCSDESAEINDADFCSWEEGVIFQRQSAESNVCSLSSGTQREKNCIYEFLIMF